MRTKQFFMMMLLLLSSTLILYGCDTGGGGGGDGGSKTGTKTFILTGGSGSGGQGGQGGTITVDSLRSVNIKKTGSANTAFSLPSEKPSYIASASEMKVASGTSVFVNAVAPGDPIPAGSYFMLYNSTSVQLDDGNGLAESAIPDTVIDSIYIAKDATVTLDMNMDQNNADGDGLGATGGDRAEFDLTGDLQISGTLTVGLLNSADGATDDETIVPSSADIVIDARNIFVTANGKVLAKGGDTSTSNGGNGGYIWLGANNGDTAHYSGNGGFLRIDGVCDASGGNATGTGSNGGDSGNCDLSSEGVAINTGNIYTNGGNGEYGGYADWSELYANGSVYNTGNFYLHGGNGTNGDGGSAYGISLFSYDASVYTKGTIEVAGGDGTANGGNVDTGVDIWSENYTGVIKVSMVITATGGNSTSNGNGGQGGYFQVDTYSGPVDIAGSFDGSGGDASGVNNSGGGAGDSGIATWNNGTTYWWEDPSYAYRPDGNITVSMTFDLSGGNGYYGGSSSNFYIDTGNGWYTQSANPAAGETYLVGYKSMDLSGGSCSPDCGGGDGGYVEVHTYSEFLSGNSAPYPTGAIINQVPITANGGDGDGNGIGANAQYVYFSVDGQQNDSSSIIKNTAPISLMGGSGSNGGYSGSVYMFAYGQVTNSGVLKLSGGDGTVNGGNGNSYDNTEIISVTNVLNSGKIDASAGDGTTGDGGYADGYSITMYAGGHVKNSGQIIYSGGDGATSGGNGGEIDLFSQGTATSNTASISVKGGVDTTDGSANGNNGHIFVDWVDITPADGAF